MDAQSRRVAALLGADTLMTDVYDLNDFRLKLLTKRALSISRREASFIRAVRRQGRPVHLPNQHFARYSHLLDQPVVISVYDLIRLVDLRRSRPELIERANMRDRLYLRLDYSGVLRASGIIAPSEATKADLISRLGVKEERIAVVPMGIDHDVFRYRGASRPLDAPYFLFVGSEHPRKNILAALRAFEILKRQPYFAGFKFVKVGAPGHGSLFRDVTRRHVRALGLDSDVVFTDRVSGSRLANFYEHAVCLVLPSRYEGFGLPPLEAMACGCPVVTSTDPALVEVSGPASVAVEACDHLALAAAMELLATDTEARDHLKVHGFLHAKRFTWARAASLTLDAYKRFGLDL